MVWALECSIRDAGRVVLCGGNFDVWDLRVRGGLLADGVISVAVEEHGDGKQLYRFRLLPRLAIPTRILLALSVALGIGSATAAAWLAATVLALFSLVLVNWSARDAAAALGASEQAIDALRRSDAELDPR
jgi:hypothetical protein